MPKKSKSRPSTFTRPCTKRRKSPHITAGAESGSFNMRVALTTALLAVIAAVAALLAGHAANEAMLEQIEASNEWSHYQSKSIKATVLSSKIELLDGLGKPAGSKDADKLAEYGKDMKELQHAAESKELASAAHMKHHVVLARSVTFFQIAIALAAIAVLTKKRRPVVVQPGVGCDRGGVLFLRPTLMPRPTLDSQVGCHGHGSEWPCFAGHAHLKR